MKFQALIALAGAILTTGCVVAPAPYPSYYDDGVVVAPSVASGVIYEPSVVIVERGVRHDRAFYHRHPEIYRRDRLRYPDRFRHMPPPPPHRGSFYGNPAPRPHSSFYGKPAPRPQGPINVSLTPRPQGPVYVKPVPRTHGPVNINPASRPQGPSFNQPQRGPRGPLPYLQQPKDDKHRKKGRHGDDDGSRR